MSQMNFNEYVQRASQQNDAQKPNFGWFSLKNAGEEAIVRFVMDSEHDVEAYTTHIVDVNGNYRHVNCLRNSFNDDINLCPLCNQNIRTSITTVVKMIKYTVVNGSVQSEPVIWLRTGKFVQQTILPLARDYAPLSQCICKITRNGTGLSTTYSIIPCNPAVYRSELYPYTGTEFNGFKAVGTVIMEKSYDDMWTYITTGSFPFKQQSQQTQQPKVQVGTMPNPNYGVPSDIKNDIRHDISQIKQVSTQSMPLNDPMTTSVAQEVPTFNPTVQRTVPNQQVPQYTAQPVTRPVRTY